MQRHPFPTLNVNRERSNLELTLSHRFATLSDFCEHSSIRHNTSQNDKKYHAIKYYSSNSGQDYTFITKIQFCKIIIAAILFIEKDLFIQAEVGGKVGRRKRKLNSKKIFLFAFLLMSNRCQV